MTEGVTRWVTKADAVRELEVSVSTLDRKIRRGEERSRFARRDAGSTCGWRGRST